MAFRKIIVAWLVILGLGTAAQVRASDLDDEHRITVNDALTRSTVAVLLNSQPAGSGFVATPERWVITNNHVIAPALQMGMTVHVKFQNGKTYRMEIIGSDPERDVAVLRPPRGALPSPPLAMGDADQVKVGETVLAKGSPFGLEGTLTQGIVSARRDITAPDGRQLKNLIQTDASINPGSSGGPLVNARGEVVGINTAIYSKTGGHMGIGFAVPINNVIALVKEVRARGAKPINGSTATQRRSMRGMPPSAMGGNPFGPGMGGPPQSFGPGMGGDDFGGMPPESFGPPGMGEDDFGQGFPGRGFMPPPGFSGPMGGSSGPPRGFHGPQMETAFLGVMGRQAPGGLMIVKVVPMSPAQSAGLRQGQVIVAANGKPVRSQDQLAQIISSYRPGDQIHLVVRQGRRMGKVRVTLGTLMINPQMPQDLDYPGGSRERGPRDSTYGQKRNHRQGAMMGQNGQRRMKRQRALAQNDQRRPMRDQRSPMGPRERDPRVPRQGGQLDGPTINYGDTMKVMKTAWAFCQKAFMLTMLPSLWP